MFNTEDAEMHLINQAQDKPYCTRFLIHSIRTKDKLKRYDGITDSSLNVMTGKTERVINVFMA